MFSFCKIKIEDIKVGSEKVRSLKNFINCIIRNYESQNKNVMKNKNYWWSIQSHRKFSEIQISCEKVSRATGNFLRYKTLVKQNPEPQEAS